MRVHVTKGIHRDFTGDCHQSDFGRRLVHTAAQGYRQRRNDLKVRSHGAKSCGDEIAHGFFEADSPFAQAPVLQDTRDSFERVFMLVPGSDVVAEEA